MRRLNPLTLMVLAAGAMAGSTARKKIALDPMERRHDPERLTKAEKKRARKNAQRLKLSQVKSV